MFDFIEMIGTYDERKVARHEDYNTGLIISTARVTDTAAGYETAVRHPRYNNYSWIIVEEYRSEETALEGHGRWVKKMSQKSLPLVLKDISSSFSAKFCDSAFPNWRTMHGT